MIAGQLRFDDEHRARADDAAEFDRSLLQIGEPGSGLERLGDSEAFARVLIDVVERHDWTVLEQADFTAPAETTAFAGGVLLIATRGWLEICASGETLGEAAGRLLEQAALWTPALREVAA